MFNRLARSEFKQPVASYEFVGFDNNVGEVRGHFFHVVHLTTLSNMMNLGNEKERWYQIDQLPDDTVEHHRTTVIPMAVKNHLGF